MSLGETGAMTEHERFMRRCIELAEVAHGRNNTPVGSVVVLSGEIVGEGIEGLPGGNNITSHAEILACQAAVDRTGIKLLSDTLLYSTAEPCFMCSYAIRQSGIALVAYGVETPDVGGVTSSHAILTDPELSSWNPAPRTLAGILKSECEQLRSTA